MNIIELAKQANGEPAWPGGVDWYWGELEAFAALVAAQEREACALLCIQMANRCDDIRKTALEVAAENIRARGTT